MSPKIKTAWTALLVVGVATGLIITGSPGQQTQAQESEQAMDNNPV